MTTLILAHDKNNGIGKNGGLPWNVKADLQHFKRVTAGKDLIVGRKTAEGLPPLKGRNVFVVSRSGLSFDEALEKSRDPIIIGGAEIYHYCLDHGLVTEIIATRIEGDYECDVFIRPDFFDGFKVESTEQLGDGHVVRYLTE